jgi:hypothetical protein
MFVPFALYISVDNLHIVIGILRSDYIFRCCFLLFFTDVLYYS